MIKLKENDIYRFTWKSLKEKRKLSCFATISSKVIVKKHDNGELFFVNLFYGHGVKTAYSLKEILKLGTLDFLANLEDTVEIEEWETFYYDDSDIIKIHIGTEGFADSIYRYILKKDAKRSKAKILQSIKERIKDRQKEIRYAKKELKKYHKALEKVETGDTPFLFW